MITRTGKLTAIGMLGMLLAYAATCPAAVTLTGSTTLTSGTYYVGKTGNGTLGIDGGSQVSDTYGYVGYGFGCTGTATVSGTGSRWTQSQHLRVGCYGQGCLNVDAGGQVVSSYGWLGYDTGAWGTAKVSGTGSTWTNSGDLYVGYYGAASLDVADGGTVTTATIWASLDDLAGNGTISATNCVLDGDLIFDSAHGLKQTITFGSGGRLNLSNSGTSPLGVGYRQTGTLRISGGVAVLSSYGYIGYRPGSLGSATISGNSSSWRAESGLDIGREGSGSLSVEAGGVAMSYDVTLGRFSSASGMLKISGTGSRWLSSSSSGKVLVGESGTGLLVVDAGGWVNSYEGHIGGATTASGTARISGTGSKWTNNSDLYVGQSGGGSLTVEAGGQVTDKTGWIGYGQSGHGAAYVTGSGAKWTNNYPLYVGYSGAGLLTVDAGGQVSSSAGYVGNSAASSGTVKISGSGSKWTTSYGLEVGYYGRGSLTIEAGGQVNSGDVACLGATSTGSGTALVSGTGSTWTVSGDLTIGHTSSLVIEAGGHVSNVGGGLRWNGCGERRRLRVGQQRRLDRQLRQRGQLDGY